MFKKIIRSIYLIFLILVFFSTAVPSFSAAGDNKDPENFSLDGKTAQALALAQDSIELDGRLDEPEWNNAPVLSEFIQQAPDEGAPVTETTEVQILYTQDNFYIGIKAYDSEPEKIRAILARRDSRSPSDWIRIYIDSYHDHRSAFEFGVNPAGVKRDVFWSNDRRPDDDWDAVWDVAVSQDEEGWSAEFRIPFSQIRGSEEAIENAQTSSARYFQRPDATHLEFDPTRTSLSGYAGLFSLSKIGGEHWRWVIGGKALSPGFEVNDIGYLREVDSLTQYVWLSYREYKPGKIFREYDISYTLWNSWDYSSTHEGMGMDLRTNFRFTNYWNINLNVNRTQNNRSSSTLRGGPAVLMPGNWRISLSLSPNFNDGFRNLQYVTKRSSDDQIHYILSRIDQTTVSMTIRLSYTITPNLTLQLYTQPYISAGDYSEFKEVTNPLAKDYDDRWHVFAPQELSLSEDEYSLHPLSEPEQEFSFSNPDFNFRQFRLNMVLRGLFNHLSL